MFCNSNVIIKSSEWT